MITILLATYNGEKYINEMIDSILAQTFTDWSLILSDDGSTDRTTDVLREYSQKYPEKITWYQSGQRFGSAQTHFMHLLKQFHDSPYIMFCDQDDVWHPDKIEKTLNLMKKTEADPTKPVLVHTDLRVVDQALQEIAPSFANMMNISGNRLALNQLLVQNVVTGCTMMINRSLAETAVSHLPTEEMLMHDWWLSLIAAAFGEAAFFPEATIDYRQHGDNLVGAKDARSFKVIAGYLKNNKIKRSMESSFAQARIFQKAFGNQMDQDKYRVISAYADLSAAGKLKRIIIYFQYDFLKQSTTKKVGQILFG